MCHYSGISYIFVRFMHHVLGKLLPGRDFRHIWEISSCRSRVGCSDERRFLGVRGQTVVNEAFRVSAGRARLISTGRTWRRYLILLFFIHLSFQIC